MDKKYWLFGLLAIWVLSSCSSRKNFVYLQDMEMGKKYLMDTKYEAVIHPNDRLSITVSCKKPELAIPFNIHEGTFRIGEDGSVDTYPEAGISREKDIGSMWMATSIFRFWEVACRGIDGYGGDGFD